MDSIEFEEEHVLLLSEEQLSEIQKKIGYEFKNTYILDQAFIRSSYAEEHRNHEDNEKLEFVGDKVLDFIIVKKMAQHYSYKKDNLIGGTTDGSPTVYFKEFICFTQNESEMTEIKKNIVKKESLAKASRTIGLEKYLFMSKGDETNGVRETDSACEDLMEAIIGAIAIDSGWNIDLIEKAIDKMIAPHHNIVNCIDSDIDYMEEFKKWWKEKYGKRGYKLYYDDKGEDAISCSLDLYGFNQEIVEGIGKTKEEAKGNFAKRMYQFIKKQEELEEKMSELFTEITPEDAVNQLQMLYQKKLIEEPVYTFKQDGIGEDGNPLWQCTCELKKAEKYATISDKTKALAKKAAAYIVLSQLIGQDFMTETLNFVVR